DPVEVGSNYVGKGRQMFDEEVELARSRAGLTACQIITALLRREDTLDEIAAHFGIAHQHVRREITREEQRASGAEYRERRKAQDREPAEQGERFLDGARRSSFAYRAGVRCGAHCLNPRPTTRWSIRGAPINRRTIHVRILVRNVTEETGRCESRGDAPQLPPERGQWPPRSSAGSGS